MFFSSLAQGLSTILKDIDKQCKPRTDTTFYGVRSGSARFAYTCYTLYYPMTLKLDIELTNW